MSGSSAVGHLQTFEPTCRPASPGEAGEAANLLGAADRLVAFVAQRVGTSFAR